MRHRGFTLVELVVVVAIVAVLAAMVIAVAGPAREKARLTTCVSNQRQIAVIALQYAQDHDETFPATASFWESLNVDPRMLNCPSLKDPSVNGYVCNNIITGAKLALFPHTDTTMLTADGTHIGDPLFGSCDNVAYLPFDLDRRHSGKLVASYLDGHVAVNASVPVMYRLPARENMSAWLLADTGMSFGRGNRTVANWSDQSPAQVSFHASEPNNAPTYVSSVADLGGNPALKFSANTGPLVSTNLRGYWTGHEGTIFVVFLPEGDPETEYTVLDQSNGAPFQATRLKLINGVPSATLQASAPGVGPARATLTASSQLIPRGDSVTLSWSSRHAVSLVSSSFGAAGLSGSMTVSPAETTTYTVTVADQHGRQNSDSVTVVVTSNAPAVVMSVSPRIINLGQSAQLTWQSENATDIASSDFNAGTLNGTITVSPSVTTTFHITVRDRLNRQASAAVTIEVTTDPERYTGMISWFRKTAASAYPPDDIPYDEPTYWTVVSSKTRYTAYQKGIPWEDYANGPEWAAPEQLYIGGSPHGSNTARKHFTGYVAEVIVYNTALSDEDRRAVEWYLSTKYNL